MLTPVHFLAPDPAGPIWSGDGRRWRVGCQPTREVLAAHEGDSFSCSHVAEVVTCPSCRGLAAWQGEMRVRAAMSGGAFRIDEGGCCG